MRKTRRTGIDKLHTLLFGQNLRITEGEPYCQVRPFDFAADFELRHLTKPLPDPALGSPIHTAKVRVCLARTKRTDKRKYKKRAHHNRCALAVYPA